MSIKKLNEIFGYGLFIVGVLKLLLTILVFTQLRASIATIFNGGEANLEGYSAFSTTIGFAQVVLAIGSIIMIILNIKKTPEVIPGYLWGLGAVLVELIMPPIMFLFTVIAECSMYMKAGTKIVNKNTGTEKNYKKIKQDMKNTEWFYGNDDK